MRVKKQNDLYTMRISRETQPLWDPLFSPDETQGSCLPDFPRVIFMVNVALLWEKISRVDNTYTFTSYIKSIDLLFTLYIDLFQNQITFEEIHTHHPTWVWWVHLPQTTCPAKSFF